MTEIVDNMKAEIQGSLPAVAQSAENHSAGSETTALPVESETPSHPAQSAETTTSDATEANTTSESLVPQRPRESLVDPRVAALRALFPDFDDALLQSVLESVGGNQDRAIDVLLGMNDPEYKSEAQSTQPVSQTDLDEQLARRLYMEDEQQAAWQAQNQQYPGWQRQVPIGRPSPPVEEKDTMAEIQDQFSKFTETGKKTLGNLFTKVKAKISEFEQGRQASGSQPIGRGGDTYPYDAGDHPYPGGGERPSYFDPNAPGNTHAAATPVRGYDTTPSPRMEQPSTPRPPPTSSAQIDTGKIGLLPKRPVSLLQTQSPPKETAQHSTDEDELEYAENPFEEGKK